MTIPLAWLWSRATKANDKADCVESELAKHKLDIAQRHFEKEEVKDIIKGSMKPMQDSIERIETSVNRLVERQLDDAKKH